MTVTGPCRTRSRSICSTSPVPSVLVVASQRDQLTSSDALAAESALTYNPDGTVATATAPGNTGNPELAVVMLVVTITSEDPQVLPMAASVLVVILARLGYLSATRRGPRE